MGGGGVWILAAVPDKCTVILLTACDYITVVISFLSRMLSKFRDHLYMLFSPRHSDSNLPDLRTKCFLTFRAILCISKDCHTRLSSVKSRNRRWRVGIARMDC